MSDAREELTRILESHGQEHVLGFWDTLSAAEKESLASQVKSLPFDVLERARSGAAAVKPRLPELSAEPFVRLPKDGKSEAEWRKAREAGEKALRAGEVAAMVVAGGQGTRLGFAGPKGAFEIGPVTDRTLFQIHAEKVLAASRRYGKTIPFLVMTGPSNDEETRAFFSRHRFFGLPRKSVRIFEQGEMPAVDDKGKVLLETKSRIFVSPNGHGGSLKALWDSGTVKWLEGQGIKIISYFQVDNPLVHAVDPAFVGFTLLAKADMSLKLLRRTDPDEKLGIWLRTGGRAKVIEYSDMPRKAMHARDARGTLKFAGGSIAIHCFSVAFVRRLNRKGFTLPFHRAEKKVPHIGATGRQVKPKAANATKLEMFVFDALEFARKAVAIEASREEEFSPVKKQRGKDSVTTARRDMSRLYAGWLEAAGVAVPRRRGGYSRFPIEISPLAAMDAAELAAHYSGPGRVTGPLAIG